MAMALALLTTTRGLAAECQAPAGFANPAILKAMSRGVNLPGWDHLEPSARPTLAQLQALRDRGFTHIRLPLDNRRMDEAERDGYLDAMVEQVVLLLSLDYAVSLDLHPDGAVGRLFASDASQAEAYLEELWMPIARKVRAFDPQKIAIELLNEPQADFAPWNAAAAKLIGQIRAVLPDNTIVFGPAGPQRYEPLADLHPFADDNVVYAIHYYDPFAFTHQGANWGGEDDPMQFLRDLPFPAVAGSTVMRERVEALKAAGHRRAAKVLEDSLQDSWTEEGIAVGFAAMERWATAHAKPIIVNEFGVLSFVAPRQSRLDWLAAVRRQAEQRCIGWAHWDFQDGFGLIDPATGMPDEGIMHALVPASGEPAGLRLTPAE